MQQIVFYFLFAIIIGSAGFVAVSRNIVHAAFALFGTFVGVAGIFLLLGAEFLAFTQVVVYAGGILVLILFGVMLTAKIDKRKTSNPIISWKMVVPLVGLYAFVMGVVICAGRWMPKIPDADEYGSVTRTIDHMGDALLGPYVLPFELISIVLLIALVAAAVVTRRNVK